MPTVETECRQVVVIGAGPSGAIAAALLKRKGHDVLMIERQHFPRFSIGESLLSHCLDFVEEAGMLDAVNAAGFQLKTGAAFAWGEQYSAFDFGDTFSNGKPTTFQVLRADFDKLLADQAALQGVEIRYGETIVSVVPDPAKPQLGVLREDGSEYRIEAQFILDASGYGRVLPRLLDLEAPSNFPVRQAVFTHVEDHIDNPAFDRSKILVTTHPTQRDIWFWTIPFSNGRCSVGVVAAAEHFAGRADNLDDCLRGFIAETPSLSAVLDNAVWDTPARTIGGYSANVKSLHGPGFALLGNAAEFLDPVFSSGVTIAMRSASMATAVLHRQLQGENVDWESEFAVPLKRGVDTFRCYVEGWYAGTFQDVIYHPGSSPDIRRMISAILAGYAWDERNPFVAEPKRRLRMLSELCARGRHMSFLSDNYVEETRFGFWFLRSHTWQHHVLRVAINDLRSLFSEPPPAHPVLLDAGCGQGKSFQLLHQTFAPQRLTGLDADPHSLELSREEAARQCIEVELIGSDCASIQLPDASVDLLFCHQTFHHLVEQDLALAEFYRVLKPGGYLLFAESTEAYIDTWVIRWLFRHPMHVQKSAAGYLQMIRQQGFEFGPQNVSYPYLWWSRARDFGLLERLGLQRPKAVGEREETLVNVVARKPLEGAV